MGRSESNVAAHPQGRRTPPFTAAEVNQIVREVQLRQNIIYGTESVCARPERSKEAWKQIAEIVSSVSGIKRSADQCRKRFNDTRRKRRQMMMAGRKRGRPSKSGPKISDIRSIHLEPEDLEFEVHGEDVILDDEIIIDDDDPDYEPSPKKRETVKISIPKEIPVSAKVNTPVTPYFKSTKPQAPSQPKPQAPSQPKPQTPSQPKPQTPSQPKPQTPSQPKPQTPSQPKPQTPSQPKSQTTSQLKLKCTGARRPEGLADGALKQLDGATHPFLELQRSGFDMLYRELSGFRDSVMSLNTRLNHLEVALRPVGQISESLARIATAVERLARPKE